MRERHKTVTNTHPEGQSKELKDIPNEIMLKVFKYLTFKDWTRLQVISKRWKDLLRDNSLWGNAKFLWGYSKEDTILPFKEKGTDRQVYADRLIREVVSITDLKFNNMPIITLLG